MEIRMAPIPQIYKPKELVISIKTPQDELFIRNFMQKVLGLETELSEQEEEFALSVLNISKQEPEKDE